MTVKREESGRRSIQVEVEVPGTPEELWETIATGPGMSAWFMPMELPQGVGDITVDTGDGEQVIGKITTWDPPHHVVGEGHTFGPGAPPVATEWTIEARSGDTSIVRVVHSLFASSDDWDAELECVESGWPRFFGVMRLYLQHYRDQSASIINAMRSTTGTVPEAWDAVTQALGFSGAAPGDRWQAPAGAPPLAGIVEANLATEKAPYALLRLDTPGPGVAAPGAGIINGETHIVLGIYLYGDSGAEIATRDQPLWESWIQDLLPAAR